MNEQQQLALDDIKLLVEANHELQLTGEDESEFGGATNNIFSGQYNDQPIVFKHFKNGARKQHEEMVLKLFAETGYVPQVYDIRSDSILVMQRFIGLPFYKAEETVSFTQWKALFHQLGIALAKVVAVGPGSAHEGSGLLDITSEPDPDYRFYATANLESFFDAVTECSARILTEKDVPHKAILERSLSDIYTNREVILSFPRFIYMDDFHYANIIADGPKLQGFIDFEMTRYGNEILVLAGVLASMIPQQPERWSWIREGYEDGQGQALASELISLAAIFAPFNRWIRFMWYWGAEEEPEWAKTRNVKERVVEDIKKTVALMDTMFLVS